MTKIRILHIIPNINQGSGVMSVIMNYYRNINHDNVQFDFLTFRSPDGVTYKEEIDLLGGNIYYISLSKVYDILFLIQRFRLLLANNQYEIIHCHFPQIGALIFPIAKNCGIKHIILHSHNSRASENKYKALINNFLIKYSIKYTDKYFACSRNAAMWMFNIGEDQLDDVYILNNAVDIEKFRYSPIDRANYRTEFDIENKDVVCAVGRLCVQKKSLFIIDIFRNCLSFPFIIV